MQESEHDAFWEQMLSEGVSEFEKAKAIFRMLPADPRCHFCHSPFEGAGGRVMRLVGKGRSSEDPRFCEACIRGGQEHPGGAVVDLAMVFADVRGSTPLAERIGDRAFSQLIDRFFQASARVFIHSGALIDRLAGDEAIGFFVPGLAGPEYARRALEGGRDVLRATGHTDPDGPWIPVGAGVHAGRAFVGMVGAQAGVPNMTALGDDINVGARIASAAGPDELLASLELCRLANVETDSLEHRELNLKGKEEQLEVVVVPLT